MQSIDAGERTLSAHRTEMVVRTLRHEVGDLLQSVYSAVAILQERLPRGQTLERTILTDLRARAETCKNELDAAHDLVCPMNLNCDWIDLSEVAGNIAAHFSLRYPALQIVSETAQPLQIWGDGVRLAQAGTLLMTSLCPAAKSRLLVRTCPASADGLVRWTFVHDGPAPTAEQLSWLAEPFHTTRQARMGLALAFAHLVLHLHGGQATAGEGPQGGLEVVLSLPPSEKANA